MQVGTCDPERYLRLHTHTSGEPRPCTLRNSGIKSGKVFFPEHNKDFPSDRPGNHITRAGPTVG